jgi:hypothetical protein
LKEIAAAQGTGRAAKSWKDLIVLMVGEKESIRVKKKTWEQ